jgi:mono/diheme cytochrome c family protein
MRLRRLLPAIVCSTVVMMSACSSADRDLPREYRRVEIPRDLTSAQVRMRGRVVFLEHCALCHGERGDGHGQRSEGLTRPPRDFTSTDWRRSTSERRVFFAVREGLSGTPMPQWKSLTERDAWNVTAYVLSLARPAEG